jgi:murein DD-endopeptidase MepM/ murein hydrolase activator NlpD
MQRAIGSIILAAMMTLLVGTSSLGKELEGVTAVACGQVASVQISPQRTYPGDVVFIRSKQAKSVILFNKTYHLQPSQEQFVRFVPIPFDVKPGEYTMYTVDGRAHVKLVIQPKKFAVDAITVSKQLNQMRQNTARIAADQKKINQARSQSAQYAYFTEPFLRPAEGRLTTPYGYQRIVNGKPANRHAAIDIANKEGAPVVASNHGRVVLADSLYLTGNTVIIDHGLHLFSIYAHMSRIDVKTGQLVKRGQQIGRIGSTGFSTGPHLHYGMLIGNTYINPMPFFEASPFSWK